MNILVFSWRDPKHPLAGGAEQVMHEHMKGWIGAGHKVTLYSSKFKGSKASEYIDKVKIIRKGYQYLGVQISGFFYYLKNKEKFNFVVDQFHGLPFFTPMYIKKKKLAVIQESAKEVWFKNPLIFPLNLIIGLLGYIFEPFIFLFYRNVPFMTGSSSAKEDVSKYGIKKENITVVPHGVILPSVKIQHQNQKIPVITFLGTLSKDKGVEDALKCFSILEKSGKYQFWVIGKAETARYFNRLKLMVKRLGLGKKVKFWGRVDDLVKFDLLSKSFILVNLSIHEGWGLVNIEANSVGTPVVAYKSAGLVDSVKNERSGIIVKENTPEEATEEIINLLKNGERYKKLVNGGKEWSKRFSWKSSKKESLRLITSITRQH